MVRAGLAEAGDAAVDEHPAELGQDLGRVRDVVEGVEAEDAVDAPVGERQSVAVEQDVLRRLVRSPTSGRRRNSSRPRSSAVADTSTAVTAKPIWASNRDDQQLPAPKSRIRMPGSGPEPADELGEATRWSGASSMPTNGLAK